MRLATSSSHWSDFAKLASQAFEVEHEVHELDCRIKQIKRAIRVLIKSDTHITVPA